MYRVGTVNFVRLESYLRLFHLINILMIMELEIVCITAQLYIIQRILFHWFCFKFLPLQHGHKIFLTSEVILEATISLQKAKKSMKEWIF